MKYLFKIFYREKLFIGALLASALMLCLPSGRTPSGKMEVYSPPSVSGERLLQAINSGRYPTGLETAMIGLTAFLLGLLAAGIILNIAFWREGKISLFSPGLSPGVGWGPGAVVRICGYYLFLLLFFRFFRNRIGFSLSHGPSALIEMVLLQNLIALLLLGVFIRRRGESFSVFKLRLTGFLNSFREALRAYVFFFPYLGVLVVVAYIVNSIFVIEAQPNPLITPILSVGSREEIGFLFILALLVVPLVEELFFRGFLYPAFKKRLRTTGAIFLSAVIFSSLHFNLGGWFPLMGLGILLAWSYEKSGKLMVPVLIHCFHNALFLAYTMLLYKFEVS